MSSWGCPHEVSGLCERVRRAYCRPGMKGCVLVGKVEFKDGFIPAPVWPTAEELAERERERVQPRRR